MPLTRHRPPKASNEVWCVSVGAFRDFLLKYPSLLAILVVVGYVLLFTSFWLIGLFALMFLVLACSRSYSSLVWRLFAIVVVSLMAVSTVWCPMYEFIDSWVVSMGYSEGVTLYLLPNLGVLLQMLGSVLGFGLSRVIYWVLVVGLNSALLFAAEVIVYPEQSRVLERLWQSCFFPKHTLFSKGIGLAFLGLSLVEVATAYAILSLGVCEELRLFALIFHPLRVVSVAAPFVVIPLLLAKPELLKWLHMVLEEPVFVIRKKSVRCYHLFFVFLVASFLLLNYSILAPDEVEFCSVDDFLYYRIWRGVLRGESFYELWKRAYPINTEAYMHLTLIFPMWFLCDSVRCVKLEYFLVCSLGLLGAFYFIKRVSRNAFLAALSSLYMLGFFTTRVFWFMLDYWSVPPMVLGLAFLAYGWYVVSSTLMVVAFFMKETTLPVLAGAMFFFSLAPLAKNFLSCRRFEEKDFAFLLGFAVAFSFAAITHSFWLRVEGLMLCVFLPHHFIRQIAWFMYPIGLINFLLAIAGVLSIEDEKLRAMLLLVVVATHLLFLTYNQPSEGAARNALAAIVVEYLTAPLGIEAIVKRVRA